MTNRPPSNVKLGENEPCRVLASGIDSLSLAIQVEWQSDRAFQVLEALKKIAKSSKEAAPAQLDMGSEAANWVFEVRPHGKDGYEWLLTGKELSLAIGKWRRPKQRPSIMASIRSETLWMHSPQVAVSRLTELVCALGGKPLIVRSSRADLCVDVLLPRSEWTRELEQHFVTRAHHVSPHIDCGNLTGFSIGKGLVAGRLYDKPREIAAKSGKFWMYDIWGIDDVPPEYIVVRVELQFRRERLKELGCNTWEDLQRNLPRLWAYGTQKWLRIVDDPKTHHTQQKLLPWWEVVASGFHGVQGAEPLVREKAIRFEVRRHGAQILGGLTSVLGIILQDEEIDGEDIFDAESYCIRALELVRKLCYMSDSKFTDKVRRKMTRFRRSGPGFRKSRSRRRFGKGK